jgi:hypothetical protein
MEHTSIVSAQTLWVSALFSCCLCLYLQPFRKYTDLRVLRPESFTMALRTQYLRFYVCV